MVNSGSRGGSIYRAQAEFIVDPLSEDVFASKPVTCCVTPLVRYPVTGVLTLNPGIYHKRRRSLLCYIDVYLFIIVIVISGPSAHVNYHIDGGGNSMKHSLISFVIMYLY